jgi:hypothetical protein
MSDSIPIIVHVLPEKNLTCRFGSEIGDFLKNNNQINKIYTADNEFRRGTISKDKRRFEASSRGGMMIYGLG